MLTYMYNKRVTSNCQGKRGKQQLDKKRLELIQDNILSNFGHWKAMKTMLKLGMTVAGPLTREGGN